ncbi:uncharacterized protein MYCFIDRAFT_179477 [Pseudocercospora fijiensis CIRAD86]|uniref:Uncharacterized protein n=1 Tax=Pseudocercospora fijiensis (strain CIRAD86) TaxID=383855 RepID=M2ZFV1_PSEFD|nr:uncharacterized protein MYCFIDRAFT_179477 [Pseudocercospora fijiensis CIRAD86]EME78029.1 hypothetical protein MYCFIDRAFT_179477 [Pseudocercospora fijiensis CIRAD86]
MLKRAEFMESCEPVRLSNRTIFSMLSNWVRCICIWYSLRLKLEGIYGLFIEFGPICDDLAARMGGERGGGGLDYARYFLDG